MFRRALWLAILATVTACADSSNRSVNEAAASATAAIEAVAHSASPTTTQPPTPRVLLVGDSTLLAVVRYGETDRLLGMNGVIDAESCRTVGVRSCGDSAPTNAVEAVNAADGSFDMVVLMAGYDEWWTSFPDSLRAVADAARAKGSDSLLVLNFREGTGYVAPDGRTATEAFQRNNDTLEQFVTRGEIPELVVADWLTYSSVTTRSEWVDGDGIHLTRAGAAGVADYISRWVAHLSARPCPSATEPSATTGVCPSPDG